VSDDSPGDGPKSNLTAARFLPGKSGNPGGRPKDLPRFRTACREKGWAWLDQLETLMVAPGTPPAEKLAIWKAVCDRGGYLPADKAFPRRNPGPTGPAPGDLPAPANVAAAVNSAIRVLAAQVAALEQVGQLRALYPQEQQQLEAAAQRLADIEASRGKLLIDALKSPGLNKDNGRTLTAMFAGKELPEAKPEEPKE
jgi:hypothetical protein